MKVICQYKNLIGDILYEVDICSCVSAPYDVIIAEALNERNLDGEEKWRSTSTTRTFGVVDDSYILKLP